MSKLNLTQLKKKKKPIAKPRANENILGGNHAINPKRKISNKQK